MISPPVKPSSGDPNYVHALAKGLQILATFAEGEMLGNQELVGLTGMPKATVSRLTSTLTSLGYLRVDPSSRKLLMGTRLLGMGVSVQRRIGLQRIARPFMERLSRETELTVSLATRDRLGMVVLEFIRPSNSVRLVTNIDAGTVLPIPNTSLGLAYLVGAPVKERSQLL
jgi:DNA-binding IclR family transcriptional regulator